MMHELSIVQALIGRVEAEARARGAVAVHRLSVRIGDLAGVETDLLQSAYQTFRDTTICRDAELEITAVPARWACPRCGLKIALGEVLRCTECALPARLEQGHEIVLDQIEMEVNDV